MSVEEAVANVHTISCRALAPLIMHADQLGWAQDALLEGVGLDEDYVRKASNPLTWPAFVRYVDNFQDMLGGPDEFIVLRDVLLPSYEGKGKLLGLVASPRGLYHWLNRWAGPSNFPIIEHTTEDVGDEQIRVTLRIPDDAEDCAAFFRISRMMFEIAPVLIGHKPAAVDLTIEPRLGTFLIDLPPSFTLLARLRRALRSLMGGQQVLEELDEQQDRLLEKHAELQKTHKILKKSEQNFRDLIEQMPDGVLVLSGEETVYANPAMHEFLGVEAGELNDGRISEFVVGGPLVATVLGLLADDTSAMSEVEFRKPDDSLVVGNIVPMEATWDGEPALVLVVQDVTERNRLMDRALQLDRVIAVGTMAAGVAHEINNPMAFIHSNLEYARETLIELRDQSSDDLLVARLDKVVESLDEALDGSTRVRDIVWDLKSFSRAPEETRVPVDIVEAVRSAINMSWHEVRNHAKVRTEYAEVPEVLANANRLSQVVLNLVVNAAQAMPNRDRDLNVITIRTLEDPERGVIEVEDNGVGIPPERLRRIFDPFFTTKAVGEGTGLGLWICQDIVTRLGGNISVESAVNRGTIFRIELPYSAEIDAEAPSGVDIQPAPPPEPEPAPPPEAVALRKPREAGRHRIIMIDDEPKILKMVERIMTNCDVITFDDPHTAMQFLHRDDQFDVVLCDATMPGMNGRDVFRRLQAEYPELAQRFVLVTGGLTTNWERTEFPMIVTKPFNIEELRSIVALVATDPTLGETPSIH